MNQQTSPRPFVLVGVDGSEDSVRALRYAAAEAHRRNAPLRVVHVQQVMVAMGPMMPLVPYPTLHEIALRILDQAEKQAVELGFSGPELEVRLAHAPRNTALLEEAEGAACIVLGRHASKLDHLLTGSTSTAVAALAKVPVIAVPPTWDPDSHTGVVVTGVDGSAATEHVLDTAFDAARAHEARLEIIHAWRPSGEYDAAINRRTVAEEWCRTTLTSLTETVRARHPESDVEWEVAPRFGRPAVALHDASCTADLLVVGRQGHGALHALAVGSVARTMLRVSECPVMVVPLPRHNG